MIDDCAHCSNDSDDDQRLDVLELNYEVNI